MLTVELFNFYQLLFAVVVIILSNGFSKIFIYLKTILLTRRQKMIEKFRQQISTIAKQISLFNFFHSPSDFWELSLSVGRSLSIPHCPWLFEAFISLFLPRYQYQRLQSNSTYLFDLKNKYLFKFYFFILFSCKLLGKQNLDYFFWFTFCLHYYGCSNSGIQFLSKFGICLSERHFRRSQSNKLALIKETTLLKVPIHHVVVWLDNYSKLLRIQIPNGDTKDFPNYSATAFSFTPYLNISRPPFGLSNNWFDIVLREINSYSSFSLDQSVCSQFDTLTVPIRVSRDSYTSYDQVPDTILKSNCTSNIGLDECLSYINNQMQSSTFFTLKCDINIYWRLVNYFYTPSKQEITNTFVPFLGVWHIFKISVIKVFQFFCNSFLADCCFAININTVFSTPSLPFALTIFLYIFQIIPRLKQHINSLLTRCSNIYFDHLYNLYTLLDNWIPSIIDFGIAISSSNFELFIERLPQILLILIECKCHSYTSAIFIFLSQINYWFKFHKEYYKHIRDHFDAFIEEKNEILLSFLSRSVVSDPLKYDHSHLANNYSFLSIAKNVISEFTDVDRSQRLFGTERVIFSGDSQQSESLLILNFFLNSFNEIEAGSWNFFPVQKIYKPQDPRHFFPQERFYSNTETQLKSLALKMDKKFIKLTNQII